MSAFFVVLFAVCWTPGLLWATPLGAALADWLGMDDETPKWIRFMYYGPQR